MLTDSQIDRYSRQIILPEIGGRGQERLLAARLGLIGEARDLSPVLDYLVGAGVGTIQLAAADLRTTPQDLRARMTGLNRDVRLEFVQPGEIITRPCLILAASQTILEQAPRIDARHDPGVLIVARLADPGLILTLDGAPPCLACADPRFLSPFAQASEPQPAIAIAAAGEAIRCLAGIAPLGSRLIEFHGYEASVTGFNSASGCALCRPSR